MNRKENLKEMKLYKKMYYRLFNAITCILETDVDDFTREKLKQAQIDTEEIFISFDGEKGDN